MLSERLGRADLDEEPVPPGGERRVVRLRAILGVESDGLAVQPELGRRPVEGDLKLHLGLGRRENVRVGVSDLVREVAFDLDRGSVGGEFPVGEDEIHIALAAGPLVVIVPALGLDVRAEKFPRYPARLVPLRRRHGGLAAQEILIDVLRGVLDGEGPGDQPILNREVLETFALLSRIARGPGRLVAQRGRDAPHSTAPGRRRLRAGKAARPISPPPDRPVGGRPELRRTEKIYHRDTEARRCGVWIRAGRRAPGIAGRGREAARRGGPTTGRPVLEVVR